ncbi:MAG TPA: NAD(+)/NADH kinase [Candidatus Avoscillospira avistercoris]|uniref:NAD kinase n=1 Tax=Candidatus Avoscillospira avistercoris TaxID=2840707 RepID=A0A9D1F9J5_9FIRM|nr:NAD(+)/NADH kinase [Candidatus Avoscillospira avistercoris]
MKVVMTPNPYRDRNFKYADQAEQILRAAGVETRLCLPFGVDKNFELPANKTFSNLNEELKSADMLICFGGDGTILHSSKAATYHGIPVLGVNIGTMGFMAELEAGELNQLSRLASGQYSIEKRMMLSVEVQHEGQIIYTDTALNDIAITKGAVARVIQMEVLCDGVQAYSFAGDGVLICTPTGSTAYSMSAGGPLVEPTARNIIVTPICAHTVQARAFVTSKDREITVRIGKTGRKNAFLSTDGGRAIRLNLGDIVRVRRSRYETRLVRLKRTSFFEIINNKFFDK